MHLIGDTIEPSFFIAVMVLSTTFLFNPVSSAILLAFIGSPAFFIALRISSFSLIVLFSLFAEYLDHIVLFADLLDQAKMSFYPVVVFMFVDDELGN